MKLFNEILLRLSQCVHVHNRMICCAVCFMFSLLHGFGWLHETLAMARVELMLGHGGRSMLSYHDATVLVSERAALL